MGIFDSKEVRKLNKKLDEERTARHRVAKHILRILEDVLNDVRPAVADFTVDPVDLDEEQVTALGKAIRLIEIMADENKDGAWNAMRTEPGIGADHRPWFVTDDLDEYDDYEPIPKNINLVVWVDGYEHGFVE